MPSGLWGGDISSSWIGREPVREIDLGDKDIFAAQNLIKNDPSILEVACLLYTNARNYLLCVLIAPPA